MYFLDTLTYKRLLILFSKVALLRLRGGGDLASDLERAVESVDVARLGPLVARAKALHYDGAIVGRASALLQARTS